ncbi:MAG: NADH-quinone oxidoreductase subunit N [Anaerolineaceae bacterium]|nr:MAG: NADH-quinone oxidoreductase subunit N [Anaerolineaceae bacterium]
MIDVPSIADLNLTVTFPAVFLALFTMVVLIVDLFIPKDRKIRTAHLTLGGLVVAFVWNVLVFDSNQTALGGMYIADSFSGFINFIALTAAIITCFLSVDYLKRTGIEQGEFYSLLLFSTAGVMFMGAASDLIVVFIALEILSIPLYVMAAMRYRDAKSEESGLKYFILGAFASAFFLYGAALVYGATGTTSLPEIFASVEGIVATDSGARLYLVLGAALIFVGLGFKVAVVPFHMWTPDVYEGAPTPVTAFMSVAAKAGGFAALLRLMVIALPELTANIGDTIAIWQTTIAIVAAATMILGNFVAIVQTNVKRMLAYSSIAHAGYILMGVAAVGTIGVAEEATRAALIYMLAYTFTNLGAFAVVMALEKDDGSGTQIADFKGLSRSRPLLAVMMAFFMLSLTGVPTTAGFIGKFLLFGAALEAGLVLLTIIGVLTSVVSAYYYVRIIVNMYLEDGEGDPAEGATQYLNYATYAAFAGTLIIGLFPFLAVNLLDTMMIAGLF